MIKTFNEIFDASPQALQLLLLELKQVEQNPKWHPEGDVFTHTRIVTKRVIKHIGDIDLILTALFHDLGKGATQEEHANSTFPTAYGHEKVSATLVFFNRRWIKEMGGNPDKIFWLVRNHMRIKYYENMRPFKKHRFREQPYFYDLLFFTRYDRGGNDI